MISGGQTGADFAGLKCARAKGLETGGWAPKGWKTDNGPDPRLADYGLRECNVEGYAVRNYWNACEARVTIWFGNTTSPGYKCTKAACYHYHRPFIENPTPEEFVALADLYECINVTGNRLRLNPKAAQAVVEAFAALPRPDGCKVCVGPTCEHLDGLKRANVRDD